VGLIVAVDRPLEEGLVERLCSVASGIKVGLPAVLRAGIEWARRAASSCRGLRVLDFKLADVAHVMEAVVEPFLGYYNAFIAHSFIGGPGALNELSRLLESEGARLVLVASMSHPGSLEVYDKAVSLIEAVIDEVDPWGLVAPATRPSVIRRLRERYPRKAILAPGVGAQGARPGTAVCAGADYEIVGRAIVDSPDPVRAAIRLASEVEVARRECRAGTG
jgi:orotidine-5'-phosphate decarboxylase